MSWGCIYMTRTGTARIGYTRNGQPCWMPVEIGDKFSRGRFTYVRILEPTTVPSTLEQRATVLAMSAAGSLGCPTNLVLAD